MKPADLADLDPASNVLVRSTNWLGDLMMSLPALRAVRERFPSGRISVHVRPHLAAILDGLSWVDEVIPLSIGRGLQGVSDRLRVASEVRERGFDLAILFPNSFDAALLPFLARIPHRLGYARAGRGPLLTHPVAATPEIRNVHFAHYLLNLLEPLGVQGAPAYARLEVADDAIAEADAVLADVPGEGPLIAMAPSAAYGPAKEWPPEHFEELAVRLVRERSARVVLVGAPQERETCERIVASAGDDANRIAAVAGRTSVAGLAALLSRCAAYVGNDSGASHVAGMVGVPALVIFGPTRPDVTHPLGPDAHVVYKPIECSPCMARTCPLGHKRCLTEISSDEIFERLESLGVL